MLAQHTLVISYTLLSSHWELLHGFTEPFIGVLWYHLWTAAFAVFLATVKFHTQFHRCCMQVPSLHKLQIIDNQYVMNLTFRGPCIVIYSYNKSQQDALFLKFIFAKELHMFRTDLLSIIRSLNTVYTAIGICHASYVDWLTFFIKNKFEKKCISLAFIIRIICDGLMPSFHTNHVVHLCPL
jgi:hypothetical protein